VGLKIFVCHPLTLFLCNYVFGTIRVTPLHCSFPYSHNYSKVEFIFLLCNFNYGFHWLLNCLIFIQPILGRDTEFVEFLFAVFTSLSVYFLLVFDEPKGLRCFILPQRRRGRRGFNAYVIYIFLLCFCLPQLISHILQLITHNSSLTTHN